MRPLRRRVFIFDESVFAGRQYSKALAHEPGCPMRVAARALGRGVVKFQLQGSQDKVNWSVLGDWQAPGPGIAVFSEIRSSDSWLRACAWTDFDHIAADFALEEFPSEERKERQDGR